MKNNFPPLLVVLLASFALGGSVSMCAQQQSSLRVLSNLVNAGHFAEAVKSGVLLTSDPALDVAARGQAWMLLGVAYHQQGKFSQAGNAYDEALHLLTMRSEDSAHYATALLAYGNLYRDLGRLADAEHVQTAALHVFERNHDSAGLAMACKALADLELSHHHLAEARRYLKRSEEEAKAAPNLGADFTASTDDMKAYLAELEGKPLAAAAELRGALSILEAKYGEKHVQVGWVYVELGKAIAQSGSRDDGLDTMRKGLLILNETVGPVNVRYLVAENAYAQMLAASGGSAAASALASKDREMLRNFYQAQCVNCSVSAAALAAR